MTLRIDGKLRGGRRWRRVLPLLLGAWLTASAAEAQIGGGTIGGFQPWIPRTDVNVADFELARHLPSAGVRKVTRSVGFLRWQTTHTLSVFAVTQRGISSRYWQSDTRTWTDWKHLGNSTGAPIQRISGSGDDPGLDFSLPLVTGWGLGHSDFIAFQGFARPPVGPDYATAIMDVDAPGEYLTYGESEPPFATASSLTLPADFNHFHPHSGFSSSYVSSPGRSTPLRNMFGTGMPRGHAASSRLYPASVPLVELRLERGRNPRWIDHGTPDGKDGVDVGSGGALSVIHDYLNVDDPFYHEEQKYVFVATNPRKDEDHGDGLNEGEIAYLRGDGQSFSWHSLGSPASYVYGAPLALKYYTNVPIAGGLGRIVLMAVGRDGSGDFGLEMQWHNGVDWASQWTSYGAPSALHGDKFKMTSAVVWYEGQANQMANLRINAFGYSEENDGRTGKLVEMIWDGAQWRWGAVREAPNGLSFRTTHSEVIDEGQTDRIVVIGRTADGRIYEFVREIQNGRTTWEGWNDLSWEPIVFERIPPGGFKLGG